MLAQFRVTAAAISQTMKLLGVVVPAGTESAKPFRERPRAQVSVRLPVAAAAAARRAARARPGVSARGAAPAPGRPDEPVPAAPGAPEPARHPGLRVRVAPSLPPPADAQSTICCFARRTRRPGQHLRRIDANTHFSHGIRSRSVRLCLFSLSAGHGGTACVHPLLDTQPFRGAAVDHPRLR